MGGGAIGKPVGLLTLQGDYAKHAEAFRALGVATRGVRRPGELEGLRALVIPGGESTTMTRLIDRVGLRGPLRDFAAGHPVLGTCAGLIMLAGELADEDAAHGVKPLGLLDCVVRRNGYGTQVDSFDAPVAMTGLPGVDGAYPAVFIRAPRIVRTGPGVEVVGRRGDEPVAIRQGRLLGLTFHPELTGDVRLHRAFLDLG